MDQNIVGSMNLESKLMKNQRRDICWTQIRELIQDVKFEDQLSEVEKATRKSLQNISTNYLGNHMANTIVIRWPILYNPKS
jgi:hypothetical protein